MSSLRNHEGADADYIEAYLWYFRQDPDVAVRFELAVAKALERIRKDAKWWAVYDERHRFVRVKNFPYHVVFRIDGQIVSIIAVAHDRRDPNYWRGRE
ncbi:MAG: type II toxin-antitoxin system RelE/ParE family toxin [Planctomycetaceae bacterium]|nr:type II toxin-antitoxin system RelE/ParE family toxin [Planctomycetaceae bacterium]